MDIKNMMIEQHAKRFYSNLYKRAVRKFQGNHHLAQEAVQETYAKALKNFLQFEDEKSSFNHWMARILTNTIADIKAKEALHGGNKDVEEAEEVASEEAQTDSAVSNKELLAKIKMEIETERSPVKREVLKLYFLKGLYPVDICKTVGRVTPDSVAKMASRFKREISDKYGTAA